MSAEHAFYSFHIYPSAVKVYFILLSTISKRYVKLIATTDPVVWWNWGSKCNSTYQNIFFTLDPWKRSRLGLSPDLRFFLYWSSAVQDSGHFDCNVISPWNSVRGDINKNLSLINKHLRETSRTRFFEFSLTMVVDESLSTLY